MVEEERDGSVPGHGSEGQVDGGDGVDSVVASNRVVSKRTLEILVAYRRPSQNPLVMVYGQGGWGFYRWTTIAMGMMTSSSSSLLCFSYFKELVKLYKCYHMETHYILSFKLI
jgi:hypothetical protein